MKLSAPLLIVLGLLATSITGLPNNQEKNKASHSPAAITTNTSTDASTDASTEWHKRAEMYTQPGVARDELVKTLGERVLDHLLVTMMDPAFAIHIAETQAGKGDGDEVQERDEKTLVKRLNWDQFIWCASNPTDEDCPWGMRFNPFFSG
ncbi:hypothetical protein Vi05172_g13516 [Venturia inaequalis]|nr:hypothetical protein Vi05172_g13516 [Venturia inaequalis]